MPFYGETMSHHLTRKHVASVYLSNHDIWPETVNRATAKKLNPQTVEKDLSLKETNIV